MIERPGVNPLHKLYMSYTINQASVPRHFVDFIARHVPSSLRSSHTIILSMSRAKSPIDIGDLTDKGKRMATTKSAADRGEVLFKLPIEGVGKVVCTQPAKQVYLVTFTSGADNRLVSVCSNL